MFWTSSILNGCITSNGLLNYQQIHYSTIHYWGEGCVWILWNGFLLWWLTAVKNCNCIFSPPWAFFSSVAIFLICTFRNVSFLAWESTKQWLDTALSYCTFMYIAGRHTSLRFYIFWCYSAWITKLGCMNYVYQIDASLSKTYHSFLQAMHKQQICQITALLLRQVCIWISSSVVPKTV